MGTQIARELPTTTQITIAALLDKITHNQATAAAQTEQQKEQTRAVSHPAAILYIITSILTS